ncbi:MAG: methylated-DNA--[protein]-cysteine S-methyltransferase [Rivihabitans pingtungensis]
MAQQLASAPRAVGGACGRNPLPIVIPCHRIVAAGGLGGFNQGRDEGLLGVKRWLLRHEGALAGI